MTSVKKVAIFLMIVGREKGRSILELMDNKEIEAVIPAIRKLSVIAPDIQKSVWGEFKELGYEEDMKPVDVLTIIRFLMTV